MAELSLWSAAPLPERQALSGRTVTLVPLDVALHGADLAEASADPDSHSGQWEFLTVGPFPNREAFLSWLATAAGSADPLFYVVVDRASGRAEGWLALMRIAPANGVIEVGNILLGPRLRRTEQATEALFLVMCYVFDGLGYRRLEWKCDARNVPSRRAAERFGFSFEGLFRQHMVVKKRNRDTAWYAMIDGEWPSIRAAFERWLDPANFDVTGRQRTRLAARPDGAVP